MRECRVSVSPANFERAAGHPRASCCVLLRVLRGSRMKGDFLVGLTLSRPVPSCRLPSGRGARELPPRPA